MCACACIYIYKHKCTYFCMYVCIHSFLETLGKSERRKIEFFPPTQWMLLCKMKTQEQRGHSKHSGYVLITFPNLTLDLTLIQCQCVWIGVVKKFLRLKPFLVLAWHIPASFPWDQKMNWPCGWGMYAPYIQWVAVGSSKAH